MRRFERERARRRGRELDLPVRVTDQRPRLSGAGREGLDPHERVLDGISVGVEDTGAQGAPPRIERDRDLLRSAASHLDDLLERRPTFAHREEEHRTSDVLEAELTTRVGG